MRTNLLYRCFNLHKWYRRLHPPCDPRATAVWIELHLHTISDEHLDSMQTHFPGQVREDVLVVRQFHPEERIGKCLIDDPFNDFWFSHICAT